jgi:hypothetical protein
VNDVVLVQPRHRRPDLRGQSFQDSGNFRIVSVRPEVPDEVSAGRSVSEELEDEQASVEVGVVDGRGSNANQLASERQTRGFKYMQFPRIQRLLPLNRLTIKLLP